MRMMCVEKTIRLYIPAGFYRVDEDKIKISFNYGTANYSISVYKNGTFDYKYMNYLSKYKTEEKELKNPLIKEYNYDTIKDYVEKESNIIEVSDYLHDVAYKFLESADLYSEVIKWLMKK